MRQAYDTQYGKTDGGAVTLVTKGGTNEFHAAAFEFLRGTITSMPIAGPTTNSALVKTTFQRNEFGGNIGGPIEKEQLLL